MTDAARIVPPKITTSKAEKTAEGIGSLLAAFVKLTTPVWCVALWWFNAWFLSWLFPTPTLAIETLTGQTVYTWALMFAGLYIAARAVGLRKD